MTAGAAYWDRQARRYDQVTLLINRRILRLAEDLADRVAGLDSVLEVAAGTGLITRATSLRVGRYVATDLSAEMLEALERRVGPRPGLETRVADLTDLEDQNASYDAVIAANVLHLLPDLEAGLTELHRVLRPGGLLLAPTFCHGESVGARTVSSIMKLAGFPLVHRFSGRQLGERLAVAGFDVGPSRVYRGLLPICSHVAARR